MFRIVPHLWFPERAIEAVEFYVSLLPNSRIDHIATLPVESPSGPAGSVQVIDFTLAGQPFQALNAGPFDPFNHAVSFIINCEDQAEVDRLWDALIADGGEPEACGWLKDRYGLCWQIIPTMLEGIMRDTDEVRGKRVAEAMLQMVKLDIQELQNAYDGKPPAS